MKALWPDLKGYRAQLVLGPLFKLAEAILELLVPLLMADIIDVGVKTGDVRYIVTHGLAMLGLGAVGLGCALVCQYFAAVCAQGFGRSLRRRLFSRVMALSRSQYGAVGTDSLITRLTSDANQVQTGVNMFIRLAVRAPFLAIGSIVMAFTISARAGTVFLVSTPLIVLVLYAVMRKTLPMYGAIQAGQDGIARLAGEHMEGVRVIRAFGRQKAEVQAFDAAGDALAAATVRAGVISAALNPITSVIANLAIVAIVWMGAGLANTGGLQQGQIIALVNYMTQTLLALIVLANIIVIFTKALASAKRVSEVLALAPEMAAVPQAEAPAQAGKAGVPALELDNVAFTYPGGGSPALENVCLRVGAGRTLGIIGGTGCGKTTLARLVGREYDVSAGAVRLGGCDVRSMPLAQVHRLVGMVPQTARLFSGTVRSNLQMGRPSATDEELWQALETAQAAAFVREKQGLDTPVEEGGKNFSGGQRQRLTIARALAAKPAVLVLDDSSSALDTATDAALRRALKTAARGMTMVLISQRAFAVKDADEILVLDDGRPAGLGTHEALLRSCEVYREICRSQKLLEDGARAPGMHEQSGHGAAGGAQPPRRRRRRAKRAGTLRRRGAPGMKQQTLRRMLGYVRPYRGQLALACTVALLSVLFTLLGPVFIGRAVDQVLGPGQVNFAGVAFWLALLAASTLAAGAAQWALGVYTRKVSALAANDMRLAAFRNLSRLPLAYFDSHPHGDIISRMTNDAELVAEGLLQGLTQLLPGVATILGTLGIMAVLNPFIAFVVVAVTPVSIWFAGFVAKRTAGFFAANSAAQGRLSGFVNEMVAGQEVVRAFGCEAACEAQFAEMTDELYTTGLKSVFYSSVTNPGTRFVNAIVYAAVGVFGAVSAIGGGITVGQLSSFLTYANQYTKPFNEVTGVLTQMQTALASAGRLLDVIDQTPETPDAPDALAPAACEGRVDVEDVCFSYTREKPLIEHFELHVKPGQRVAIVGPTGCGKTTLINLLMRFYDVDSGRICVDGVPVRSMRRSALRGMYGMVLQETWLKNATVRENIAYGRPGASLEEVQAAARAAWAHGFIQRLPQGYDTVIAPGGGNLSAGQKQLLCIARIMLCRPDMLILDEATSNIDTRTEMLVQRAFEALMAGHTSFVVAHRLSTVRTADVILVMEAGRIVEQGTHEQLLAKGGAYARLYESQFAPA